MTRLIVRLAEAWHTLCGRGSVRCCGNCKCFHRYGTRCE